MIDLDKIFLPHVPDKVLHPFGVCEALTDLLLIHRFSEVNFDLTISSHVIDAISWMFVKAIPDLKLFTLVDDATLRALNEPLMSSQTPQVRKNNGAVNYLSALLLFCYNYRKDVKAAFDISREEGEAALVMWFLTTGVEEMGLHPLINEQWRGLFIHSEPQKDSPEPEIFGYLSWLSRQDIRDSFDINTPNGVKILNRWSFNELQSNYRLSWLRESPVQRNRGDFFRRRVSSQQGVNLIGYLNGCHGVGEDLRMAMLACKEASIPFRVIDVAHILRGEEENQEDRLINSFNETNKLYSVNVFCLTAFDTFRLFYSSHGSLFKYNYNIGWWPWELPNWPRSCIRLLDSVDEIWSATSFTYNAFISIGRISSRRKPYQHKVPVNLMPMAAKASPLTTLKREDFGVSYEEVVVLYIFDCKSSLSRKNPAASIEAFKRAFHSSRPARLILKTMNADRQSQEWQDLISLIKDDPRIILIHETYDRPKTIGLLKICDIYISLHRSEGFGRTIAEALLLGKRVVCTDFSGNTDFISHDFAFPVRWKKTYVKIGQYPFVDSNRRYFWADPIISEAAAQLLQAVDSLGDAKMSANIARYAREKFSPTRIGREMKDRLSSISREIYESEYKCLS